MHVTLIGASNIGKTHWADRLAAEYDFEKIDCDFLVEEKTRTGVNQIWLRWNPRRGEMDGTGANADPQILFAVS